MDCLKLKDSVGDVDTTIHAIIAHLTQKGNLRPVALMQSLALTLVNIISCTSSTIKNEFILVKQ